MASPIFPPDRVTILAVLNLTPDSFSDGGRFLEASGTRERPRVDRVVDCAARLVAEGAHGLDVGGESTRPGATLVEPSCELDRVLPVVEALAKRFEAFVSIDTRKAVVADAALDAGARVINDVSGLLFDPEMAAVAARRKADLVIGHLRGTPQTMQRDPHFNDVLAEVTRELDSSIDRARSAGVSDTRLAVDPGIGFGKRLEDNLALIAGVGRIRKRLGLPVMLGPSRKAFLGALTGDPVERRDAATAAAVAVGCFAGADAIRVHDVASATRAVTVGRALAEARFEGAS
ncbi:dihydropteroate synthase [Myxococcota bacterium]|nr:dihydropteroate synthase [Myxococcota bacterium]